MTITATGAVSLGDLRTEFVGGIAAISFGDLYRGGSNIRKLAVDNTATNDAASVPTAGAIDMADFYSSAKSFTKTYSATATDQDASAVFGADYSVDYPKNIVIDSGVELGATSVSEEALQIDAGGSGTITITNNGTLSGAGGAAGAVGGDAFEADVTCTFINNGTVRAGGGGGGTGGNGSYTSTSGNLGAGVYVAGSNSQTRRNLSCSRAGKGACYGSGQIDDGYVRCADNCRTSSTTNTYGGAGGVGAGYNQSSGTGAAGGTNAGTGGDGGGFGASGSTGTNGNVSNGSAGGSAGNYLNGSANCTFTNNGTVQGNTV
jgi:hypothetical protein